MYKNDVGALPNYNPFSRLFTLKEWFKIIIFFLLVISTYLYAIQYFVYYYHTYPSTYDPTFITKIAIITIIELLFLLILPLFYIAYVIGKESRLVPSVRFSFVFMKLFMLYTILVLLFIPEMYMYYQVYTQYNNIIFNNGSSYSYWELGQYARDLLVPYAILLIFIVILAFLRFIIHLYVNRKHTKNTDMNSKYVKVGSLPNEQPILPVVSGINSINFNSKELDQSPLIQNTNITKQPSPPAKIFNKQVQLENNKETEVLSSNEFPAKPKSSRFNLDYLIKTYIDKQEWYTIVKFYYLLLLANLTLTFGFTIQALFFNTTIYDFYNLANSLFLITAFIGFIFPFIYTIQNYRKKLISENVGIWIAILILIFELFAFVISNILYGDLYQFYSLNAIMIHCLLVVVLWVLIGVLGFAIIYHKKIDLILSQHDEYTHLKAKFNLDYILYYKKTRNMLLSSKSVEFLIKQFFLLQTNEIKAILPVLTPLNLR